MMEKMLVTQALDERDLLVKKINDKIELDVILPYAWTIVHRNLAESNLDPAIKAKLYDFVYNKTLKDLINPEINFTKDELKAMVDAMDLDAILWDLYNDRDEHQIGYQFVMLLFDFIGDETLI